MNTDIKIAPSILSADFSKLGEDIKMVEEAGADIIHYDVMDGHFVPNMTIGPLVLKDIRKTTKLPIDVHLMISNPDQYIPAFADAGADMISVHYETCPHLHRTIQLIHSLDKKAGVVLNPHTPLHVLDDILPNLDFVLIMSVNPGFGGQKLIPETLTKVSKLKNIIKEKGLDHVYVEIDGGVNLDNFQSVVDAGADWIISGSAIYGAENPSQVIASMKEIIATAVH